MNAGRDTRPLPKWAVIALALSAVVVLALAATAATAFFNGKSGSISDNAAMRSDISSAFVAEVDNEPTGPNAAHIKEVDAQYPLSDKITVYGDEGERIALADVDPDTYTGFVAYMSDDFVDGLDGSVSDGDMLADGIKYVCGNLITASDLDTLEAFVTDNDAASENDISFIEPNYNLTIIDDEFSDQLEGMVADASASGADVSSDGVMTQMALTNDDYSRYQTEFNLINLQGAWSVTKGADDVLVAVIDGGLMGTGNSLARDETVATMKHEDIDYDDRIVPGYNFIAGTDSTEDIGNTDVNGYGHGSFVAGQIVATADNGIGVAGVAPGVKVTPYKVFDVSAKGSTTKVGTIDAIYSAILYAVENGVDVANMSLGWTGGFDKACYLACKVATDNGVILVAAAGNSKTNENTYPAAFENVIGVSATKKTDGSFDTTYSNYGESNVVVSAPGSSIYGIGTASSSSYKTSNGTSMASPIVAATAALAKSVDKSIDTARFIKLIQETSLAKAYSSKSTTAGTTYDDHYGWGLLNAGVLVNKANNEKQSGKTYLSNGFVGETCWTLSSDGDLDLYPVTPNDRTYWYCSMDGQNHYPWEDNMGDIKAVTVNDGVNLGTHDYYAVAQTMFGMNVVTLEYQPTLQEAFKGASNCETFDLSGLGAASTVSTVDMFADCTSAKSITFGDSWKASATFPECADGETEFLGWKVIFEGAGDTSDTLFAPGDAIPASAASFEAVFAEPTPEEEGTNPGSDDPEGSGGASGNAGGNQDREINQLSVTMPLDLRLTFGNHGFSNVTELNKKYGISNSGSTALKIVDVEMVEPSDDFEIDAIYKRGKSGYLNYLEKPIEKNTIMLVYNDGTNYTYIGNEHPLSAATNLADGAINDDYPFKGFSEVVIPANSKLDISFADSICYIPGSIPVSSERHELCKIVYTVAAA